MGDIKKTTKGFALVYAVLVTSVVLIASLLISDIITRQIIISSLGKNYQYAYYIANAGRECAKGLDYDTEEYDPDDPNPYAPAGFFGHIENPPAGPSVLVTPIPIAESDRIAKIQNRCFPELSAYKVSKATDANGVPVPIYQYLEGSAGKNAVTTFKVENTEDQTCAIVIYMMGLDSNAKNDSILSVRGFNMGCTVKNNKKVEALTEWKQF